MQRTTQSKWTHTAYATSLQSSWLTRRLERRFSAAEQRTSSLNSKTFSMRKPIPRKVREEVYAKYDGHCAYCGCELKYEDMQVDHMIPLWIGGADEMSNYMPACRQCNHYKRGNSLEGFRKMIEQIPAKLERDSYIYRVGINYGNVIPHEMPIVFYFERR